MATKLKRRSSRSRRSLASARRPAKARKRSATKAIFAKQRARSLSETRSIHSSIDAILSNFSTTKELLKKQKRTYSELRNKLAKI